MCLIAREYHKPADQQLAKRPVSGKNFHTIHNRMLSDNSRLAKKLHRLKGCSKVTRSHNYSDTLSSLFRYNQFSIKSFIVISLVICFKFTVTQAQGKLDFNFSTLFFFPLRRSS